MRLFNLYLYPALPVMLEMLIPYVCRHDVLVLCYQFGPVLRQLDFLCNRRRSALQKAHPRTEAAKHEYFHRFGALFGGMENLPVGARSHEAGWVGGTAEF